MHKVLLTYDFPTALSEKFYLLIIIIIYNIIISILIKFFMEKIRVGEKMNFV